MKIIITFAILCFALLTEAAEKKPGADAVVVKVFDQPLPSKEDEKESFLWKNFASGSKGQSFSSYRTDKWKDNFSAFAKSLGQKAEAQKLDSASLSNALDLVLKDSKDKIAYLPVAAYQTTLEGKLVWVIVVCWEYPSMGRDSELGHARKFVFEQKTLKQVGFVTCG